MSTPASDESLLRLALDGDSDAFGRIFDRHASRVHRHSIALVPQPDDAKDVVATTFLEAWRRRTQVRFVDGSLLPWLLVTATHSARNLSRGSRRYRQLLGRVPAGLERDAMADPADLVADEHGEATAALASLSRSHQEVVTLCILEGLSLAEAASVLGVPVGTIKSRLFTAKRTMAVRLGSRPIATLRERTEP